MKMTTTISSTIEPASDIDFEDWSLLLRNIIRQAMDDYIKLQHPKYRDKKYLQEDFQSAIDMFFDDSYRFLYIQNSDNIDMNLTELLVEAANTDKANPKKIQQWIIEQTKIYWEEKYMETINIPEILCIEGTVYNVLHKEGPEYLFDYDNRELYIDKRSNTENEKTFILAVSEAICYHLDIRISKRNREELAEGFFRTLKINNSFREVV